MSDAVIHCEPVAQLKNFLYIFEKCKCTRALFVNSSCDFSPEQLWILNPKRIIKNLDMDIYQLEMTMREKKDGQEGKVLC